LKQAQGLRRKNGHFHQTRTHFSLIQTSQIHIHEKTEQRDFFMPLTSHQNHLFSPRENIPLPGSEFWIQATATRVAGPVKEKRMFFLLALSGRTRTGSPAPLLSIQPM
jgi:hypothetical protein